MEKTVKIDKWKALCLVSFVWFMFSVPALFLAGHQQSELVDMYNDLADKYNACQNPPGEPWTLDSDHLASVGINLSDFGDTWRDLE